MEIEYKISVVVPAYNAGKWLYRCIDSILNQTYQNIEVILIDDGSTDETPYIADKYAKQDKRVKVYHQNNSGLVATRNAGIRFATGQYIGFVDADDSIEKDMYQRLLANALKYDADISQCGILYCFDDGRRKPMHGTGSVEVFDNISGQKALLIGKSFEPSLCNKIYSSKIITDSCLDATVVNNEDLLRNFVLFQRANKSVFEDFCGYNYWRRSDSMSNNMYQVKNWTHIIRARKIIINNCKPEVKPEAYNCWLSAVINAYNSVIPLKDLDSIKFKNQCRMELKQNKASLQSLGIKKNLVSQMILYIPHLYNFIYSLHNGQRQLKIRREVRMVEK